MGDSSVLVKQLFTVAATVLLLWTLNAGLSNIGRQLERQAIAAEQQTKLLQEPGAMSKELGELVNALKELQAAEVAPAPKR